MPNEKLPDDEYIQGKLFDMRPNTQDHIDKILHEASAVRGDTAEDYSIDPRNDDILAEQKRAELEILEKLKQEQSRHK